MNKQIYFYKYICVSIAVFLLAKFAISSADTVKNDDKPIVSVPTDSSNVRISLFDGRELTTLRIQACVGDWRAVLQPQNQTSSMTSITNIEENTKIPEGEDMAVMLTSKGITAHISVGEELETGYSKIEISGGELMLVEIPNNRQPILLRGKLEIILGVGGLRFVNEITLRDYLVSSVSELTQSPEPEAVMAVLIAARSRVLRSILDHPHATDTVDLCDKAHCMPFSGEAANRELVAVMAEQCVDEAMVYNGKPIFARFQDTCGGKISSCKDIYGVEDTNHQMLEDRLDSKSSENCFHSPSFTWVREFSQEEMADFLSFAFAAGADNTFISWTPIKVDPAGRITEVILRGKREKRLSGIVFLEEIQKYFGPNSIKSMRLTFEPMRRATVYRGSGCGDGVGMCLFGADGLAKKGLDAYQILKFYYRNFDFSKKGKVFIPSPSSTTH